MTSEGDKKPGDPDKGDQATPEKKKSMGCLATSILILLGMFLTALLVFGMCLAQFK